jgi:putative glutamine amidotransferase
VAPDLAAAAYADDGIVEAIVVPDLTFAVGVQWHPEMMFERHVEQMKPFQALVEAAMARRLAAVGL